MAHVGQKITLGLDGLFGHTPGLGHGPLGGLAFGNVLEHPDGHLAMVGGMDGAARDLRHEGAPVLARKLPLHVHIFAQGQQGPHRGAKFAIIFGGMVDAAPRLPDQLFGLIAQVFAHAQIHPQDHAVGRVDDAVGGVVKNHLLLGQQVAVVGLAVAQAGLGGFLLGDVLVDPHQPARAAVRPAQSGMANVENPAPVALRAAHAKGFGVVGGLVAQKAAQAGLNPRPVVGVDQVFPAGHVGRVAGQQGVFFVAQHFGPDVIDGHLHDLVVVINGAVVHAQIGTTQRQVQALFTAGDALLDDLAFGNVIQPRHQMAAIGKVEQYGRQQHRDGRAIGAHKVGLVAFDRAIAAQQFHEPLAV